jgi:serine protease Do
MASFDPQDYGFDEPPPRPTTPPVRRGFLVILFVLCLAALVVYGVPYVAERTSYAWEAGRARADSEALAKLDKEGIVNRASLLFRMATEAVSPAVVNVQGLRLRRGADGFAGMPLGANMRAPALQSAELGSGIVIDKDKGFIVTNNHVIKDADEILVRLGPGDEVTARLVGADVKSDLAVLRVRGGLKVQAEWGDSDRLDIGEWVLAIGNPLGLDRSATAGIVSATQRNDLRISEYESFIQTDAAITSGNSGGPLINLAGKVIGINTAMITDSGGYAGIGLAIPSSLARKVVDSLIKQGKVVRGYLGVRIQPWPLDAALARKLRLPNNHGALITGIPPGSPAEQSGLKPGDVIIKLADHDVVDAAALRNLTAGLDVGTQVPAVFYRDGKQQTTTVTIAELPPAPEVLSNLGFGVREINAGREGGGHIVEIDRVVRGGPAFQEALLPGMRIVAVGEPPQQVNSLAELEVAVRKTDLRQGLALTVRSADGNLRKVRFGGPPEKANP